MTTQPRLFPPPPIDPQTLPDRQQHAIELLTQHPEGLRSSDLGRAIHIRKGCPYCSPDRLCKFAHSAGEEVGKALRKKKLVKKPHGRWRLLNPPVSGYDPSTADIPF